MIRDMAENPLGTIDGMINRGRGVSSTGASGMISALARGDVDTPMQRLLSMVPTQIRNMPQFQQLIDAIMPALRQIMRTFAATIRGPLNLISSMTGGAINPLSSMASIADSAARNPFGSLGSSINGNINAGYRFPSFLSQ